MDEILLTALISAGAGLAGVVVGSVLSLVGQYIIPLSDYQIDREIGKIIDSK